MLLELTILRFGWTFNFDYANFTFAGVIWVIGWSMVVSQSLTARPSRTQVFAAKPLWALYY